MTTPPDTLPDSAAAAAAAAKPDRFPSLGSTTDLAAIDKEIVAFWAADGTFQASIDQRPRSEDGGSEFVFYDGPPFANGLPHYGHLLTGFVKDVIPRFQTMRGNRVERRFGWDTHGLPAELQAEKELGISGRKQILDFGMEKFNDACRKSVLQFTDDWETYVNRQARWVDFENDYKTLDISYMESCLWAFKTLYERGHVYQDYRVVPYSWAVESPLSNFETRLDNSYRTRIDPAVTVAYALNDVPAEDPTAPTHILIWTTTPWTLPSNLAVAVNNNIDYAVIAQGDRRLVISANAYAKYAKQLGTEEPVGYLKGSELVGCTYTPPFPYFADTPNAFRVLAGDFVEDGEGTGIVHMAPGFGEDDLVVCRAEGIPVVVPVDQAGRFTDQVPDYAGLQVFEANKPIITALKEAGVLIRQDSYPHNYPHCWRTDEPLIYKAVNSWYLRVSDFRERMVELNQNIAWLPGHIKEGLFGNWLANARDWNIARSRFWGTPIPVWLSDDPAYPRVDVYGSIAELEADFGVKITNLHRPYIDELVRPNPDDPTGKAMMRRVEDVFDCWYESGAMPFAQVHYPFQNKKWFESHFPGDFIVEYVAQTRGWFYTLMVLGTMVFDQEPFRACICHGVVLDENKQKLSKRLRNYPDPIEFFDQYGSDVMRWFLISSTVLAGGDVAIPREGKVLAQAQREALMPLANAYSFFALYANIEQIEPKLVTTADAVLDRYILSKVADLAATVAAELAQFEIPPACHHVTRFMDALNNWYIRRSRARFWGREDGSAEGGDARQAFDVLYTVLVQLCQVMAPLAPILTEKIYRALTGDRSVHLTDWPDPDAIVRDHDLVAEMDLVRAACSATLAVRERARLRVRLPLAELTIAHPDAPRLAPYLALIQDEVNVKAVTLSTDLAAFGKQELKVNPRIGKVLGAKMKPVMAASKAGNFTLLDDGRAEVAGEILTPDQFDLRLVTPEGSAAEPVGGLGAAVLNVAVTPELEREGLARDIIRAVQVARKDADFAVTDRIALWVDGDAVILGAVTTHQEEISGEVLALSVTTGAAPAAATSSNHAVGGTTITLGVQRT